MIKYGVLTFMPGEKVLDTKLGPGVVESVREDGVVLVRFGGVLAEYSPAGRSLDGKGGELCQD